MEKKLLQLILFFFSLTSLAQEGKILISGRVLDSLGIVKNANIINLKTNQGTFSFDDGRFEMFASLGDSLRISSVQHVTKTRIITQKIIDNKALILSLKYNTYVLDEFELKRNNLIGKLTIDIKSVPKDFKAATLKRNMDFSNVDFSIKDQRIDDNIRAKSKIVNTVANSYSGLNAGGIIGGIIGGLLPGKKFKKTQSEDKKRDRLKAFHKKILSELGEDFFFNKLKIPRDKYFHFLEYCDDLRLERKYNENKILEIIKIFKEESTSYLITLKEE